MPKTHRIADPAGGVACGRSTTSTTQDDAEVDCKACLKVMAGWEQQAEVTDDPAEVPLSFCATSGLPGEGVCLGGATAAPTDDAHNLEPAAPVPALLGGSKLDAAIWAALLFNEASGGAEQPQRPVPEGGTPPMRLRAGDFVVANNTEDIPWPVAAERRPGEDTVIWAHVQHPGGRHSAKVATADLRRVGDAGAREQLIMRKLRRQGMVRARQVAWWLVTTVEPAETR